MVNGNSLRTVHETVNYLHDNMEENEGAKFKNATVSKMMTLHFQDDKIRVGADVLSLMAELLQLFVMEAATRAARQAEADGEQTVEVLHCEKVLPQLLLDF